MRTGKGRTFTDHKEALDEEGKGEGKGLVGGDLSRQPGRENGLQNWLDPASLGRDTLPELRRLSTDEAERADLQAFVSHRPLEVEIGFGGGQFLRGRAAQHPDTHFIGFEIRRNLCISMVEAIVEQELENLRIVYEDMRQALPALCAPQSLQRCSVFFPDPWWKKRHVKRRILVPSFLDMMVELLAPDGVLHIKTDVMPYAEAIAALFAEDPRYTRAGAELDHLFASDLPTEREAFCLKKELPFEEFRYILTG